MLLSFLSHCQWTVGQFVILTLLRVHSDGIGAGPELAVYRGSENPHLVCPVMDHQVTGVARANVGCKVQNLRAFKKESNLRAGCSDEQRTSQ